MDEDFQPDAPDLQNDYGHLSQPDYQINKGRLWGDWPFQPDYDQTPWQAEFENRDYQWGSGDIAGVPQSCLGDAGDPPDTGTYVLGSVDGTCQWINTTTCS